MSASVREFYDSLAADYHLIFEDWDRSVERQARALTGALRSRAHSARRVLDCTCGIGTQCLGFAGRGYRVTGSDLSVESVRRARAEASRRGLELTLLASDVRRLPVRDATFDAVVSLDNSLPHLLSVADLRAGIRDMVRVCRRGGVVLASVRDYASAIEERRTVDPPRVWGEPGSRRMTFQIWNWLDERTYRMLHVIGEEDGGGWRFRTRETSYRAVPPRELAELLESEGLVHVEVLEPRSSGYYQPLVVGSKR